MRKVFTKEIQGVKKIENAFNDLVSTEKIQKDVLILRKKFKIPKDGFPEFKTKDLLFANELVYVPARWVFRGNRARFKEINLASQKFADKIPELHYGMTIFRFYLFHNTVPHEIFDYFLEMANVCKVSTMAKSFSKEENKTYPIAIKLSPYATQRDVSNFITQNWEDINFFQEKYQNPNNRIGKTRTRTTRTRDSLINSHKNLPRKEISKLIKGKLDLKIDEIYVRNIISKNKKKG